MVMVMIIVIVNDNVYVAVNVTWPLSLSPSSIIWYRSNRWEGNGSIWERCGLPPI